MNILVTGGAGFIGANFVLYWLENYPADRVIVYDALTYAGNRTSLPAESEQMKFVHADILDAETLARVLDDEKVEMIVHFAAESHVDRSITGPQAFLQTNVMGTFTLLEAARARGLRFHHVSTDEVYGTLGPEDSAFTEETAYTPNSPYSASKAGSDHLVRAYFHTYGLPVTTSNCSNNYGPYHFPEKLIPLMITNALRGLPLPVYGDGLNIRDWLYVEDHCWGIDLVIKSGQLGETYNIGGVNEWKNIDLVHLLCRLVDEAFAADPAWRDKYPDAPAASGKKTADLIQFVTDRPGHDRRYAVDTTKARTSLGYEPKFTFEQGIRKTVEWYLRHRDWWEPLILLSGQHKG